MKSVFGLGVGSAIATTAIATTAIVALSQPAWAAATQITGVEVNESSGSVELLLKQSRPGDRPQVFSVERGSSWVADIINSQLVLPEGGGFQSLNPAPGIASIQVVSLDSNSVRVIVTGETGAPTGELTDRTAQGLAFTLAAGSGGTAAAPAAASRSTAPGTTPGTVAQRPEPQPEVLVPNPEITITGGQPTAIPRQNPAPPFLPRAVAPPLGDIAVSELAPSVPSIDLGTVERVPRLVLRDAPAREVLALLARAAGLNLAFIGGEAAGVEGAAAGGEGPAVTLDIEGEPVQDVFNYVLRLTNLKAVRQGRTILVGEELPAEVQSRNTIVRTLRVNQAEAAAVANFLVAQGAEARLVETVTTRTVLNEGTVNQSVEETQTTQVTSIAPEESANGSPSVLRGLTVVTDSRLNSITLVGDVPTVELATSFSKQLDLRQRQVAVNVKVVDVDLNNEGSFSSNFSFGINDSFVVSDGGAATMRFGATAPATSQSLNSSAINPPVIPYTTSENFTGLYPRGFLQSAQGVQSPTQVDLSRNVTIPNLSSDSNQFAVTRVRVNPATGARTTDSLGTLALPPGSTLTDANGSITVPSVNFLNSNPLSPSVTGSTNSGVITGSSITPGQLEFVDVDNNGIFTTGVDLIQRLIQPQGSVSQALPQLFQFPTNFLASIQAQVTQGNAKILTDPTLVVQEGQSATINLTSKVITGVNETVNAVGTTSQVARTFAQEDVGLLVSISVPRIDDNGFVTMEIQPRISTIVDTATVGLSTGASQTINVVGKRELNSGKLRLRDGQTLIIAGVITEQEIENITKWPILGDIPILGTLFRNTTTTRNRREVVIVVTPQIMDDSDRSNFGYSYTPGPDAQELIDRPR